MISRVELNTKVSFTDDNLCSIVSLSLETETENLVNERVSVSVKRKEKDLFLTINARDSVSARAAMNSFLKLIEVSLQVIQKTEKLYD